VPSAVGNVLVVAAPGNAGVRPWLASGPTAGTVAAVDRQDVSCRRPRGVAEGFLGGVVPGRLAAEAAPAAAAAAVAPAAFHAD